MGRISSRAFLVIVGLTGMALALSVVPAGATTKITAAEECCLFVGSPFTQAAGETAELVNPGPPNNAPHNAVANGKAPSGGPLFSSSLARPGQTVPVEGTEYLAAGRYPFRCTLHTGMNGVLEVTSGSPVPRPRVAPTIRSRSLDTVRRTGKLDLGLKASARADSITVEVEVKGRTVAVAEVASLESGKVKNVSARLTAKGRKAIGKGSSVRFQVTATADFGLPGKTSKQLKGGQ